VGAVRQGQRVSTFAALAMTWSAAVMIELSADAIDAEAVEVFGQELCADMAAKRVDAEFGDIVVEVVANRHERHGSDAGASCACRQGFCGFEAGGVAVDRDVERRSDGGSAITARLSRRAQRSSQCG